MEFFERAHVKRNAANKNSKSDAIMKKQLKQMLHGYKENDNKLIKTCVRCKSEVCDPQHCFDDSSSVSGFSDLNLTNSSCEGAVSQDTLNSQIEMDMSKDTEHNASIIADINVNDDSQENVDSISECSVNMESLPDDSQSEADNLFSRKHRNIDQISISNDNLSFELISTDNSQDSILNSLELDSLSGHSSVSGEFDPDGSLASKILDKLNKIDKTKKGKKRKLEDNVKHNFFDVESESESCQSQSEVQNHGVKLPQSDEDYEFHASYFNLHKENTSHDDEVTDRLEAASNLESLSDHSSPYISITATNTPSESLSEVLGEYRHPTVRNLPCEIQFVHSNAGTFLTEDVSIEDAEVVEENSSLIPEIDDELTVRDLELSEDIEEPIEESTSLYDNTLISETSERQCSQDITDNLEITNSVKVYCHNNTCIFVIKHPGKLYVHGKIKVKALGGTVEVFGYTLKDEWCDLYAPNYSFAQCLQTVQLENAYHGLFSKLTAEGLSVSKSQEIVANICEYDGVIAMYPLKDRKMHFVDNNFTITDIFEKQSKDVDDSLLQASQLLNCSLYLRRPWRVLETHPIWDEVVICGLETQSRGIICGGKGSGKSTFLRYCVNRLLSKGSVLVIDLDPGQAEFTVAGNVSATIVDKPLLGINFTHLQKPLRMLNIGLINTMDKPSLYINAVDSLLTYCQNQEELKTMPWILNTMGMCNNIGLKFITNTILKTNPTYLIQMDSTKAKKRFEFHLDRETVTQLYYTSFKKDYLLRNIRIPQNLSYRFYLSTRTESLKNVFSLAPRDERYLNFLAYFGELLNIYSDCEILDIVPYEVNLKDLNVMTNVNVPVDSIAKVLNGKIVALCQHGAERGKISTQDIPLLCVGHGLIRGIDCEKGVLYVLSPTPAAALGTVDTVAYGDWVPELRGQEKQLPAGVAVPYRTAAHYSQRRLMYTPRRRFNPLQLLKMSRSS